MLLHTSLFSQGGKKNRVSRMILIILSVLVELAVASGSKYGYHNRNIPTIRIADGTVSGTIEQAVNGRSFYSFYGIPYASPPVGELRFKDPIPNTKWDGVLDASTMPAPCMQIPFQAALSGTKLPPEHVAGSDDCLKVNVFTPKHAMDYNRKLPVMVYIHSGAFYFGGAHQNLPHVLMSKDVILVVMQYRLGALGFMSTEDSVMPGNFGLKDQSLALQWVHKNIHNFAGDSRRVVAFGVSSGAASVNYHLLSPKSKGLFNGAIMGSGTALSPWAFSDQHRIYATQLGALLGCNITSGSQEYLKCMQSLPANVITAATQEFGTFGLLSSPNVPRVDGDFLPDHPAKLLKEGRYNKVNTISGVVADEGCVVTIPMYGMPEMINQLIANFPLVGPLSLSLDLADRDPVQISKAIYDHYIGGLNFTGRYEMVNEMMGNHHFSIGHDLISQIYSNDADITLYRYEVTHRGQLSSSNLLPLPIGRDWVCHGDDLYYLFRGGDLLQPTQNATEPPIDITSPGDLRVRELMLTTFTNFAALGNPTPDRSLGTYWAPASPGHFDHLVISPKPWMSTDKRENVRQFHNSLPTEINRYLHPHLVKTSEST